MNPFVGLTINAVVLKANPALTTVVSVLPANVYVNCVGVITSIDSGVGVS